MISVYIDSILNNILVS